MSPSGPDPLDPGPAGFAHRGLHYGPGFPENSWIAFAAALERGCGIECDLRLTADNRIVVFHDKDAMRICASPMRIGQSTLDELSRLQVGKRPIPTLEELLSFVGGRVPLLLEIKVDDDLWRWGPPMRELLLNNTDRIGVMSFDPRISSIMNTLLPNVRRGLVVRADLAAWRRKIAVWLAKPQFLAIDRAALGKPWVAAVRRRMPVYSWTIRTPEQRRQAEVHADALIWEADGRP